MNTKRRLYDALIRAADSIADEAPTLLVLLLLIVLLVFVTLLPIIAALLT